MKAIILENHGDYNQLKYVNDFPNPILEKSNYNYVIVKILYTTVNRLDITLRKGYQSGNNNLSPFIFPHILGSDVIGEIIEINIANSDTLEDNFKIGDKIISLPKFITANKNFTLGLNYQGTYCEYIKLPISALVKLPQIDNNEIVKYAGLPTSGLIAMNLFSEYTIKNNIDQIPNLLLIGGGGGVGTYIVQLAKYFGFNVITTAGNQKNINSLYELEANDVFNHYDLDFKEIIFNKYNQKIDLVIDYLGGDYFSFYIDLISDHGKIKVIGAMGNRFTNLDLQKIYSKNISIQGQSFGTLKQLQELVNLTNINEIKTVTNNVYSLDETPNIHNLMENKSYFGKNIIKF